MAGVYFRDNNINKDGTGAKRSTDVFRTVFKEIFPNNLPIQKEKVTQLGWIITFVHEKDANLIFNQQVRDKLAAKNMMADLSSPTHLERDIYLINVPANIYQYDIQIIKSAIVQITGHKTLDVRKFNGNNSRKNYIVLTIDSKEERDNIINLGPMPLFGATLTARKPIPKLSNSTAHQSQGFNNRSQPLPGNPTPAPLPAQAVWTCPPPPSDNNANQLTDPTIWPILPQGTPYTWQTAINHPSHLSTLQPRHQASPPSPTPRPSSHISTQQPSYPAPPPPPPTRTGENQIRPPNLNNENDLKFFVQASATICKIIHEGLEDPAEFLFNINEIYSMHGLPVIDVPNNQLLDSKLKFFRKSATSSITNITASASQPHTTPPPLSATSPPLSNQCSTPTPSTVSNSPIRNSSPLIQFSPAYTVHTSTSAINSPSPSVDSTTPLILTPSAASSAHINQSLSFNHQPTSTSTFTASSHPSLSPSNITLTPNRPIYSGPINSPRHLNPIPINLFHPYNANTVSKYPNYTIFKETADSTVMRFSRIPESNPSTTSSSLEID